MAVKSLLVKSTSYFLSFLGGYMWIFDGDNTENWGKKKIWPQMDHSGPFFFASNCVCV